MSKGETKSTTKKEKQARPLFILAKVVDENGNVIPEAKLKIASVTRNTRTALTTQASDRDLKVFEAVAS